MFRNLVIIAIALLVLGGCSANIVKDNDVVTVDPDVIDKHRYGELRYEPTPDQVVVGEKDGIVVEVLKRETFKDEQINNLELQRWDATAMNMTTEDKCVTPLWRLMDFEYISDGPSEQYVPANSIKTIGVMQQKTWILDGTHVALPPSGYLADLRVRGTIKDAKPGEECTYVTDDDNVEEWKDD